MSPIFEALMLVSLLAALCFLGIAIWHGWKIECHQEKEKS